MLCASPPTSLIGFRPPSASCLLPSLRVIPILARKNYTSNYRIQVPLFKGDLGGSNFCSQILENWYYLINQEFHTKDRYFNLSKGVEVRVD
jgi:hypothetical protein